MIGLVEGEIRDDMIDPIGGDIRDDMIDPIGGVDVVGLEPLGNLVGKPPSAQQSITTSLILAGTVATKPDDSSDELPQGIFHCFTRLILFFWCWCLCSANDFAFVNTRCS